MEFEIKINEEWLKKVIKEAIKELKKEGII